MPHWFHITKTLVDKKMTNIFFCFYCRSALELKKCKNGSKPFFLRNIIFNNSTKVAIAMNEMRYYNEKREDGVQTSNFKNKLISKTIIKKTI